MRRLIALVLAQGLVASAAVLPSLHVHEYGDHEHQEHRHAAASHEHERPSVSAHDGSHAVESDHDTAGAEHAAQILESCDPGEHAVAVAFCYVPVRSFHADLAEVVGPRLVAPVITFQYVAALTDIRVHGPPACAQRPSRAPPLTHLA